MYNQQIYPEAETLVQDEDTMPLSEPIIKPIKTKTFSTLEKDIPATTYSTNYLTGLMDNPMLVRNIAVVGNLHHGKTTFLDMLIESTHEKAWKPEQNVRYTDTRTDEQARGISIKSTPVSLVLPSLTGKSYVLNIMDTPGHSDFIGEVTAALRISDAAVLLVDAVEGVMIQTERVIEAIVRAQVPIIFVINKMDRVRNPPYSILHDYYLLCSRNLSFPCFLFLPLTAFLQLITDLKLPPNDAYFKIVNVLHEINSKLSACGSAYRANPQKGNVVFASSLHSWCFNLESYAQLYGRLHGLNFDHKPFAQVRMRFMGFLYILSTGLSTSY